MGLRLSNKYQDVGTDDRQAEVEQNDGSFRANISEEKTNKQKKPSQYLQLFSVSLDEIIVMWLQPVLLKCNYLHSTA